MLLLTLACLPCPPRTHTLFPLTGRWKSAYARVKMANRMKTGKLSMLNVRTSKGQSVAARLDRIESSMGGLDRIVIEVRQKQAASDVRAAQFELTVNARFDSVPSMQTIVGTIRTEIAEVSREHGTHYVLIYTAFGANYKLTLALSIPPVSQATKDFCTTEQIDRITEKHETLVRFLRLPPLPNPASLPCNINLHHYTIYFVTNTPAPGRRTLSQPPHPLTLLHPIHSLRSFTPSAPLVRRAPTLPPPSPSLSLSAHSAGATRRYSQLWRI